jgi:hypothetical protein
VQKSCLVVMVIATVLLTLVSVMLRRQFLSDTPRVVQEPRPTPTEEQLPDLLGEEESRRSLQETFDELDALGNAEPAELMLLSVTPLVTEPLTVYGLSADDSSLYALGCEPTGACGTVVVVDQATGRVRTRTYISGDGYVRPGGLQVAGGQLYVWLLPEAMNRTLMIVLDKVTLIEQGRFTLQGGASALAVSATGFFGVSADGRTFYRWDSDGKLVDRLKSTTEARYADCEPVAGALVCAGVQPDGSPSLDVLNPSNYDLLARHVSNTTWASGEAVFGGQWANSAERFFFAPQAGELPLVWTYALNGTALNDFVPAGAQ